MGALLRRVLLTLLVSVTAVAALACLIYFARDLPDLILIAQLSVVVLVGNGVRFAHGPAGGAALNSVVLLAVYIIAGPAAAVVVAGIGSLMQPRGVPLMKRVFNSSHRILSAAGGALIYLALDGPSGVGVLEEMPTTILIITAAGVAHQVVNAALMCAVLGVERGKAVVGSFIRDAVVPTALPMLGYGLVSVLMAVAWLGGLGIVAGLLAMVPFLVARWALTQDDAERAAQAATMRAFIELIETKDLYTRGHSERVSAGVGMLGRHLRLPEERLQALENAGLLHDVGKVGVPTSIIRKPGRLDDSEMDAIRLHPARGVELIGTVPFLEEVKSAVLHHHEKYDGSGYPAGLGGTNIPYFARIIAIVDAFDCLTSTRSYRPARSVEETLAILEKDRHSHFDPELVDEFTHVIRTQGWASPDLAQPEPLPDGAAVATIDHDDLSLDSGGGASGTAAGPGGSGGPTGPVGPAGPAGPAGPG